MFTGIVEEVGQVALALPGRLVISAERVTAGTVPGDSISVNGVCLTATGISGKSFSVDIMPETLRRTNLGALKNGDRVNLERPLTPSGRLGGHLVQGHVDGIARVSSIMWEGRAMLLTFETPLELMRYIVEKGFIAVNGISLTIVAREARSFQVSIVDYTREHTNLGEIRLSDTANIEVDIIAKYVEQLVKPMTSGLTLNFLRESGFLETRDMR